MPSLEFNCYHVNVIEKLDPVFHGLGMTTYSPAYTLPARFYRASLYRELQSSQENPQLRSKTQEKIKDYYLFEKQFRSPQCLTVDMTDLGLGLQSVQTLKLYHHDSPPAADRPPIAITFGIGSDPQAGEHMLSSLYFHGQNIIAIANPESYNGQTTPEFAHAVSAHSESYEPHTTFFKRAVRQLFPDTVPILMGYSSGGALILDMLKDKDFQAHISSAIAICPASCINSSKLQLVCGFILDFAYLFKDFSHLPEFTFTLGQANSSAKYALQALTHLAPDINPTTIRTALGGNLTQLNQALQFYQEISPSLSELDNQDIRAGLDSLKPGSYGQQLVLRQQIYHALIPKVASRLPNWETAQVSPGGSIVIASYNRDFVTHSVEAMKKITTQNEQLRPIFLDGSHSTPLVKTHQLIAALTPIIPSLNISPQSPSLHD